MLSALVCQEKSPGLPRLSDDLEALRTSSGRGTGNAREWGVEWAPEVSPLPTFPALLTTPPSLFAPPGNLQWSRLAEAVTRHGKAPPMRSHNV